MPDSITDQFVFVKRHLALKHDEYFAEIDEFKRGEDQFLLVHLRVQKFTPFIFKRMKTEWAIFRQCVRSPIYAAPEVADDKWVRFVTALGFKPFKDSVRLNNGLDRPLYIHTV